MKEKFSSKLVALVFSSLAILFLTAFYLFAWTEPSQAPPGGNVAAPVNVGSATQYKSGALGIGGLFRVYSDAIFDGKVGIGTTGPGYKLDVNGNMAATILYDKNNTGYYVNPNGSTRLNYAAFTGGIDVGNAGGAYTYIALRDDESQNGVKYIHANSNVVGFLNGAGSWITYWDPSGNMQNIGTITANAYYCRSDINLKENLQKLDNPLGKIMSLEGMSFIWKNTGKAGMGFTAQDVEKVFPELVSTNAETGLKSVQYDGLIAPLVEALKEQQKEIDGLNAKIDKLMQRIEELESGTRR